MNLVSIISPPHLSVQRMSMLMIMMNGDERWAIDTRLLDAFVAVARTKSISKAADELSYVQSAVSQQLASLERVVGHRLVDRGSGPRPVTLTAAGSALLPHAVWILERLEAARVDMQSLNTGSSGSLRVGTFQSAGARLLPRVLAAFRKQWPAISISIYNEGDDGELSGLVRSGAIDVAFVESENEEPGLTHVSLLKDSYVALLPPGHRLAKKKSIKLIEFAAEDMVFGSSADSCSNRLERAMREVGFEPRVAFRAVDNPMRQRMVDAGLGCAVQPNLTVEVGLHDGAVIRPLAEDIHRTIGLTWASDKTPSFALTSFIEVATAVLTDLA
jgi:DNA-binding transcriptional LysR family regulator